MPMEILKKIACLSSCFQHLAAERTSNLVAHKVYPKTVKNDPLSFFLLPSLVCAVLTLGAQMCPKIAGKQRCTGGSFCLRPAKNEHKNTSEGKEHTKAND